MGIINHNAIVVTGFHEEVKRARDLAVAIFSTIVVERDLAPGFQQDWSQLVTPQTETSVNGYASFLIAPDGSKEGWGTSNAMNDARDAFVEQLERMRKLPYNNPNHLSVDWIELSYGEIAHDGAEIVGSSYQEREGT